MTPPLSLPTPPPRSLSSELTSAWISHIRNPHGRAEEYPSRVFQPFSRVVFCGRIFATEYASLLLCTVAAVETVAYGILFVPALPYALISYQPLDWVCLRLESSAFTVYWNAANAIGLNFVGVNLPSSEQFARLYMDYSRSGQFFRKTLQVASLCLAIIAVIACYLTNRELDIYLPSFRWVRDRDFNYLTLLVERYQQRLAEGEKKFFQEHFYQDLTITDGAKTAIAEHDPESYVFILARIVYLFAKDPSLKTKFPGVFSLLKNETQLTIAKLETRQPTGLEEILSDLNNFSNADSTKDINPLLNEVKGAAGEEIQGKIILSFTKTLQNLEHKH